MDLGSLISALESKPRDQFVRCGFGNPHSYRGSYDELAFEPVIDTTVGAMLDCARSALGKTFEGYKGGSYQMNDYTDCHLSFYGTSANSEALGPVLLALMLGDEPSTYAALRYTQEPS